MFSEKFAAFNDKFQAKERPEEESEIENLLSGMDEDAEQDTVVYRRLQEMAEKEQAALTRYGNYPVPVVEAALKSPFLCLLFRVDRFLYGVKGVCGRGERCGCYKSQKNTRRYTCF